MKRSNSRYLLQLSHVLEVEGDEEEGEEGIHKLKLEGSCGSM